MSYPLLSIQNLSVAFGSGNNKNLAVKKVSYDVNPGEVVAVVGESGSGKSVTALSVLQLLPKEQTSYPEGNLLFCPDGSSQIDLLQTNNAQLQHIRGSEIAMIFQEPMTSLNPVFTCGSQVMETIRLHRKCNAAIAREATLDLFNKVQLPDPAGMLKKYPHELSGGQKQRVMIAMAISCNPSLLIADEPTTALDVTVQKSVVELLANLQAQRNMGMIFITHDLGLVQDIADKVVVMYKGEIVEQNNTRELFRNPVHPYTKALLACRPILYPKGVRLPVVSDFLKAADKGETDKPSLQDSTGWAVSGAEKSHGRKTVSANKLPVDGKATQQGDTALLRVNDLKVWYPVQKNLLGKARSHFKAVDGISFDLLESETLGIVGESGCGKTTLGRAILRLVPITGGSILYKGDDLAKQNREQMNRLRKDIQLVFQDPYGSLNPRISVGEAIREAMTVHGLLDNPSQRKEKVIELLEKVNMQADHYHRHPHAFSGGQRQRIGIARALALNPGFIVFDESVSALDVSVQAQVLNLINDLKAEFGFTALFISHDLGVVKYISDRILVMNKGKMEEIGPAEDVFRNPQSDYTKRLLDAIPGQI
ncbi:ABC transporter ATP-binding protein [Flavihumibacter stibioxidans]|uniref:ABC transporter ATP-binding protein n=1 Tax=Flavihumibacter stibioxidans TaxID=1834163 RepID=A0ABR7M6Q3_9BACT|nr:dipeptide ABC transporter ATP-binding protein [Flavihumibacter stibioxidans]MBC6490209.1 ABC transporter ATP-binding protein [Flavihumibacter stibioxidans]